MGSEKDNGCLLAQQFDENDVLLGDMSSVISSTSSDQPYDSKRRSRRVNSYRAALPWLLHILLLAVSTSMLTASIVLRSSGRACVTKLSEYSPGLLALNDDYQKVRFRGSFGLPSPYKGPPTPEVDARWSEIENMGAISITEEEFQKLNASKHAVKVPSDLGGGYMALPEYVHQIHCVILVQKMLWAHTYPEYYTEEYNRFLENPKESHEHLDHCANLLRQKLECDADMTLITYNWIKNHYMPHPNFNVQHKCRNFNAAKEWTLQRTINTSSHEHNYFTRPDETVADFDEPPFDPLASE